MIVKPKDKVSTRASLEMSRHIARAVLEALADAAAPLRQVMDADPDYPADPRQVLAAVVAYRRQQAEVDLRVAELLAWLEVGGVTRTTMTRALGVRPATLQKMLAPAELIASARHVDLHRGRGGRWTVQRLTRLPDDGSGDDAS